MGGGDRLDVMGRPILYFIMPIFAYYTCSLRSKVTSSTSYYAVLECCDGYSGDDCMRKLLTMEDCMLLDSTIQFQTRAQVIINNW